ncbi:DegV family protein [Haploplasma axanthum]|uniref:DegV-like protein n=1 Tax=Haploplasma axanthum TaxID=29552 RepID=A0A449BCC5_HAPAX|nr:DegV family protein [Haploplasma axanthum]VEU80085.1 degV-like protein [Haploplasma axanthum]
MKQKIGIVVCGNSGIDYLDIDFPIEVIRATLVIDKKEYEDFVDITAEKFYDIVVKNPNIDLSTSQTSTGRIADVYEKLKNEGYTDVIVVTVSSKLSGTFQGAVLAKELVEGINIYPIDSRSVSQGEVYLVLEAIKMIKEGKEVKTIIDKLEKMRDNISVYVLVDTLKYLVKNGRLSATSGFLGTLLKIKPLLKIQKDGSLVPHEKIRTTKKARERLIEIIKDEIKGKNIGLFIVHTNNRDEALSLKEDFLKLNSKLEIDVVPLTPVVGVHAGPGTLAVGYIIR